jgi:hypothetical protein
MRVRACPFAGLVRPPLFLDTVEIGVSVVDVAVVVVLIDDLTDTGVGASWCCVGPSRVEASPPGLARSACVGACLRAAIAGLRGARGIKI